MKQKTKDAAEWIRQGFLALPPKDLVDLFEWLFERSSDNGYEGDFETELRESLGYRRDSASETDWADHDGEALAEILRAQDICDFAHGAGALPFYAGLLAASPLDNPKMLLEERKFGELLIHTANISEAPFLLIKIRFQVLESRR